MQDMNSAGFALLVFAVVVVGLALWANRDKIKNVLPGRGGKPKDGTRLK